MADILPFQPVEVGAQVRFNPDEVLDQAKGQSWHRMAIIGQTEDGNYWISGNANAGELLILIEQIKHAIVFGDAQDGCE